MKQPLVFALLLSSALTLGGCGFAESFQETQAQSETVAAQLEKELGFKPMVGWNIRNNNLANVNVVFESRHVENVTIGQLTPAVRRAVDAGFKRQPQQLLISVQVGSP